MLALGASFDAAQAMLDGEVDGAVVAKFEVQEGIVGLAPPVAAVERIRPHQVERAGDRLAGAEREHQHHLVAETVAEQRKELRREVGAAPFAIDGGGVEAKKRAPMRGRDVAAAQGDEFQAAIVGIAALAADRFAFARRKGGEEIVEAGVAGVVPMKLHAHPAQPAGIAEFGPFGLGAEGDVNRGQAKLRAGLRQG